MKILLYAFECLYSRAKYVSIYQAHSVLCFISTVSSSTTIRLLPQSFLLFSCVPVFTFSTLFLNMLTYEMCVPLSLFFFLSLKYQYVCLFIYPYVCPSVLFMCVCVKSACVSISLCLSQLSNIFGHLNQSGHSTYLSLSRSHARVLNVKMEPSFTIHNIV